MILNALGLINNDYITKEKFFFLIALYDLKKHVNYPSCHIKTDNVTDIKNLCIFTRNFNLSMLLIIHTI